MSTTPLLDVRMLSYSFRSRVAVDGVSFSIQPGEFFGLLGPNGAGKSTTISCIAGLMSRFRGAMFFRGEPFSPASRAIDRQRIGIVPQDLAVYDNLSNIIVAIASFRCVDSSFSSPSPYWRQLDTVARRPRIRFWRLRYRAC